MRGWLFGVMALLGCDDAKPIADAPIVIDGVVGDAAIDGALDAPPDAELDAPDAPPDWPREPCTPIVDTGATSRISHFVRLGDVIYYAVFTPNVTTGREVRSIHLDTGVAGTPFELTDVGIFATSATAVFVAERTKITQVVPGPPAAVVEGRANIGQVGADTGNVYWNETTAAAVLRRSVTGGAITTVFDCNNPWSLEVVGSELYCGNTYVAYTPSSGGAPLFLTYLNGYPVHTLSPDGAALYAVNGYNNPQIYRIDPAAHTMTLVFESPLLERFSGLGSSPSHFYVSGDTTKRIRRTTLAVETFFAGETSFDPIVHDGHVYLAASDSVTYGMRFIQRCGE